LPILRGAWGKSTLSTHVAGYFASRGHTAMLGDVDRQQSSRLWLGLRPVQARAIASWETGDDRVVKVPKGVTHAVLDTPAGLHGWRFKDVLKMADKVLIPLQPSIFDIYATRDFLRLLAETRHGKEVSIGLVGMRVDERTIAANNLHKYVDTLGLPVLGYLRDTQNYVHLAASGLTLFDVAPSRVAKDLAQWLPICHWLDS
jgi:chromosome partitioning protein